VRDGIFEIEHGGVGVRAVWSGAFRREGKARGKTTFQEIYALPPPDPDGGELQYIHWA
jgi:hypothetical protein